MSVLSWIKSSRLLGEFLSRVACNKMERALLLSLQFVLNNKETAASVLDSVCLTAYAQIDCSLLQLQEQNSDHLVFKRKIKSL
jgi:hypothetical protein